MEKINIKGKDYIPVNERIKEFWRIYPEGRINTNLLSVENGVCIVKAEVFKNSGSEKPEATGYAYELESSSFINKTSYIENCETSAIGRALGILGIGIDTSVASADEVDNAMLLQKTIDQNKMEAIDKAIKKYGISDETVDEILEKFGYKGINEILVVDYQKICNEFKEAKNE